MASNSKAATAAPQKKPSKPAPIKIDIYVISYNARDWSNEVTLSSGREARHVSWGSLDAYDSPSKAQHMGVRWAMQELQNLCERYNIPLSTDEDKHVALKDWQRSESTKGDLWRYSLSNGTERLLVQVDKNVLHDS